MPQMAAINWLILFIMFSMIFLLFNVMNYFQFLPISPKSSGIKINNMNKHMNWKW